MREKVRITAIGSCRISTPFKRAPNAYPVLNNSGRVYGYTHSSAEALQQLRFLQGEFSPDPALLPILMPNTDMAQLETQEHTPSDIYFVELSSAKRLRVGATHVQLNYVTQHYRDFFADRAQAAHFWKLSDGAQQEQKRDWLSGLTGFQTLSKADQSCLLSMTREMATLETVSADMREIAARVPNVVFITHCNALTADGAHIASRNAYIQLVEQAAQALGLPVYNPTAAMLAFGQADAMSDAETSLSHYSDDFADFLFDGLFERYMSPRLMSSGRKSASKALGDAISIFETRNPVTSISPHLGGVAMITGSLGAGGAERQLTRLAGELTRLTDVSTQSRDLPGITGQVEVIVSTLSSERGRDFFLPKLQEDGVPVSVISDLPADSGAMTLPSPLQPLLRDLPPQTVEAVQRLTPHLLRTRPEVAYIWQDGAVLTSALAALAADVPRLVISLRGMPPNLRPEMMKDEYFDMYLALSKVPGVQFSANTYAAADSYADWLGMPRGSILTVHNAADALPTEGTDTDITMWEEFTARTADADFTFGGVFRFDQNKRAKLWLEFAAAAYAAYPRSRFVLVGDGAELTDAKALAAEFGFSDRCLFTGRTPSVGYWLNRMDALGLTSRLEGLPNVLIEAQFAGVPVISTPAGGAGEAFVHGQTGYLMSDTENPKLPEFLRFYLNLAYDAKQRRNMGIAARKFARQSFSIDRIMPQTLDLLSGRAEPTRLEPKVLRA